jgi:peptide/nickel transport system substrate-binding protein
MKNFRTKFILLLLISTIFAITAMIAPVSAAGGTIVIGTTDSISNLDPANAYDYFSSNTLIQLGHGLMEMPVDSTDAVEGPIVESLTVSSDAKTFTFVLKPDILFSDDEPLDAAAVKFNLDRAMSLDGDPGFLLSDVIDTVTADGLTLTITLQISDATFLQRLTYTVAWPFSPASLDEDAFGGQPDTVPAGLGPYVIDTWTKDTEMILTPNPNYLGDAPSNDKVIIKFYTDASALLTAIESGEIDVAHKQFGPDEIIAIKANEDLEYVTKDTAGIRYLIINVDAHDDLDVRQAIAAAVDRSAITSTVFDDLNSPILTMVPKIFSSSKDVFVDGPDTTAVDTHMTAAGYSSSDKYEMDLHYTISHYGDTEIDVAQLIKTQLESTGYFDVTLVSAEWSTYLDGLGIMGLFLLGWWFDYPDATNYIDPFVGAGAFSMGTNYSSATMDGYLETMFTNTDAAARKTASEAAQTLMAADVPVVPLFSMLNQFSAFLPDVEGYVLEPSENVHYNSVTGGSAVGFLPIGQFGIAAVVLLFSAALYRRRRFN